MCEGGSGLLGGEVMRRESWRVERRDSVERLANDKNIIGRYGRVGERLVIYGR